MRDPTHPPPDAVNPPANAQPRTCDVLVAGGGPAGSTAAALLAARGLSVVLCEKERHPRFHIGESLLPMSLPVIEQLGVPPAEDTFVYKQGAEFLVRTHRPPPPVRVHRDAAGLRPPCVARRPRPLRSRNMFWDFGAGQIGDMGSHTMDLLWNAVDAKLPTSADAKGEPMNSDVTPVDCEAHFEHPANDWRAPSSISWYQGGAMPRSPKKSIDLTQIGHGAMFKGTKGFIISDFDSRIILPFGDDADMSYYKPRKQEEYAA